MYLSITGGFKHPNMNEILSTDVEISDEMYNKRIELESQGKMFKIKDINGATFEEIFEEYTIESEPTAPSEIEVLQEQVTDLQSVIVDLTYNNLLGGV